MKSLKLFLETMGPHDESDTYNQMYSQVEPYLGKWGAGEVRGWRRNRGIAFHVTKGSNVEQNDWIVVRWNPDYDDYTVMLSEYGEGDEATAKSVKDNVYSNDLENVIDRMLGI